MYDKFLINEIIQEGNYDLTDLSLKIERGYLQGAISHLDYEELLAAAQEHANPEDSYATDKQRILNLEVALRALEERVAALEASGTSSGSNTPTEEFPAWVQPSGAHDSYSIGDKVTFNGQHYRSLIDNNVWSPATYPQGWEIVEGEE